MAPSALAAPQAGVDGPGDVIRIATIGMGGMGFGDTRTALELPGTRLVAAADCYDGRLARTRETFGKDVTTTRDYREILDRPDVDAVIVATPDHWHSRIAVDAMRARKAVYLEKPMIHDLAEGPELIRVEKETGQVLVVGSQRVSSAVYAKAGDLFRAGVIGTLNMVEARYNRNSAIGAWQYSIPTDASPKTVDWERFLGPAPARPFDPVRFFRWRNYWDYGTGVAGDLFVHLFSGIHFALGANGPRRVTAIGGLRHWKDGRDAPDVMVGLFDYPETPSHPPFTMSLQVNFADGSGGSQEFRFVGDEGIMTISGAGVGVSRRAREAEPGYTIDTFAEAEQKAFLEGYRKAYPKPAAPALTESGQTLYEPPRGYDDRREHFAGFFHAMRTKGRVTEDATFGYRAAAPALLCNQSYCEGRTLGWDPDEMRAS
ncbi:MAG TPA: Gfo/Idh/MocA family oxidoreductase [Vicinamibacteria bacterium]|nr:Gfo/Idh/MocA family oxidoreductase [Vicinamibacteria bacterium]